MATKETTDTKTEAKQAKNSPWPLKVKGPRGQEFVLEQDDALVCIYKTKISLEGSDGRRYHLPPGCLTSKKLFPNWSKHHRPAYLIEFKGDPHARINQTAENQKGVPRALVVKGFSAR